MVDHHQLKRPVKIPDCCVHGQGHRERSTFTWHQPCKYRIAVFTVKVTANVQPLRGTSHVNTGLLCSRSRSQRTFNLYVAPAIKLIPDCWIHGHGHRQRSTLTWYQPCTKLNSAVTTSVDIQNTLCNAMYSHSLTDSESHTTRTQWVCFEAEDGASFHCGARLECTGSALKQKTAL